jgi:hypothetical protein
MASFCLSLSLSLSVQVLSFLRALSEMLPPSPLPYHPYPLYYLTRCVQHRTCMTAVRKDCGEKRAPRFVTLGSPSSPVQMSSCLRASDPLRVQFASYQISSNIAASCAYPWGTLGTCSAEPTRVKAA